MTLEQRDESVAIEDEPRKPEPQIAAPSKITETTESIGPPRTVLREYFESLVVTAVMAIFGMTFIVQAVKVPTGSMQNTILIGDHLLVNKFIFAPGPVLPFLPQRAIQRGDVIVFKYPGKFQGEARFRDNAGVNDNAENNLPFKTNYVKRVIGLPGDVVEIRGAMLRINGQPLDEHLINSRNPLDDPATSEREDGSPLEVLDDPPRKADEPAYNAYWDRTDAAGESEKFTVPENHYFVLGDNRSNSQDGRYWGYVPRELIFGRAMFVYWSFDEGSARSSAFFPLNHVVDFFVNTRWSRTGTLIR